MRKSAIQLASLPRFRFRYGMVAAAAIGWVPTLNSPVFAQTPANAPQHIANRHSNPAEGSSSRESRDSAVQRIPFQQLTAEANARLHSVVDTASYFRRMPTETVDCDHEMYSFLIRNPEVVVNIWEVMGVTKVTLQRTGPFQLQGDDGSGTTSKMDLIFGNDSMHIYFANGSYRGNLWARELNGRCVVILHNRPSPLADGRQGMMVSMDVFMKLENLGADLVVKTLGPLVGKSADYNFTECASFFAQVSQTAEQNPYGIQQLAKRLNNIDPKVRDQFIATSKSVSQRAGNVTSTKPGNPTLVQKSTDSIPFPTLSLTPKVPPPDASTRRQLDAPATTVGERVDSPTILLISKEEQNKLDKTK